MQYEVNLEILNQQFNICEVLLSIELSSSDLNLSMMDKIMEVCLPIACSDLLVSNFGRIKNKKGMILEPIF